MCGEKCTPDQRISEYSFKLRPTSRFDVMSLLVYCVVCNKLLTCTFLAQFHAFCGYLPEVQSTGNNVTPILDVGPNFDELCTFGLLKYT